MKWLENPILRAAAVVGAIGVIGGAGLAVVPTRAEYQYTDNRSLDNKIRWLLQDKFNYEASLHKAVAAHEKLFWKAKIQAVNIEIKQAIKRVRK